MDGISLFLSVRVCVAVVATSSIICIVIIAVNPHVILVELVSYILATSATNS